MRHSLSDRRMEQKNIVDETMAQVHKKYLETPDKDAPDEDFIAYATAALQSLANDFTVDDFPAFEINKQFGESKSVRKGVYLLSKQSDGGLALYAIRSECSAMTPPHTHETWSLFVPVKGTEKVYEFERKEEGRLRVKNVQELEKDKPIFLGVDGIHSNNAVGQTPTLALHLYGKCFEDLAIERVVPDIFVTLEGEYEEGQSVEVVGQRKMFVEARSYFRVQPPKFYKYIFPICSISLILSIIYAGIIIWNYETIAMNPYSLVILGTTMCIFVYLIFSIGIENMTIRDRYYYSNPVNSRRKST